MMAREMALWLQLPDGTSLLGLAPLLFIFAIFYFLLIMPQQRKQKKTAIRGLSRRDQASARNDFPSFDASQFHPRRRRIGLGRGIAALGTCR